MSDINQITGAFTPDPTATTSIAATAASQSQALPKKPTPQGVPGGQSQIQFYNNGTVGVFVDWGKGSATAIVPSGVTVGSNPVPPGAVVVYTVPANIDTWAVVGLAAGPSNVYATPGIGV